MTQRILFFLLVILLSSCGVASEIKKRDFYSYRDANSKWAYIIDFKNKVLILGDSDYSDLEFCTENDEFVCYYFDNYAFSIPRDFQEGMNWTFKGMPFKSGNCSEKIFADKVLKGIEIEREAEDTKAVYFFSFDEGLQSIEYSDSSGLSSMYVIKSNAGFGKGEIAYECD